MTRHRSCFNRRIIVPSKFLDTGFPLATVSVSKSERSWFISICFVIEEFHLIHIIYLAIVRMDNAESDI